MLNYQRVVYLAVATQKYSEASPTSEVNLWHWLIYWHVIAEGCARSCPAHLRRGDGPHFPWTKGTGQPSRLNVLDRRKEYSSIIAIYGDHCKFLGQPQKMQIIQAVNCKSRCAGWKPSSLPKLLIASGHVRNLNWR